MKKRHTVQYILSATLLLMCIIYFPPFVKSIKSNIENRKYYKEEVKRYKKAEEISIRGAQQQEQQAIIANDFPYTGADVELRVRTDPKAGNNIYFIPEK